MNNSFLLVLTMAASVKLFRSLQRFCRTMGLGIHSFDTNESKISISLKRLFFGYTTIFTLFAFVAFIRLEAQTIDQYANAIHGSMTELNQITNFHITAWQMQNILKLIGNFERFIEKRERINIILYHIHCIYCIHLQFQELRQVYRQKCCTMESMSASNGCRINSISLQLNYHLLV